MGEDLLVERRPVAQGAEEAADVDEVEGCFGGEGPGHGGTVVDFELQVGRHVGGLDGGEVGADDGGAGVLVGEVDGPDAGAGADVEDLVGWCKTKRRGVEREGRR